MNPQLYQLLCGAGIEDVVIPRKKFISEHNHLIKLLRSSDNPALQKEANSQSDELHSLKGGFTQSSGFIRRLMAENALKHKGQYQNPTYPLHPESTMNKPAEFKYNKLASTEQNGSNPKEYGASPFIQKHFAHARAVPFVRKRGVAPPNEPFSKRKPKKTQESEQQKEAREVFERKTSEASLPPKDDGVFVERPEEEPEESKYKEEPEESKYKEEPKESKYKEEPEVEEKKSEAPKIASDGFNIPTVPKELRQFISDEDIKQLMPSFIWRAKLKLLQKKARKALPNPKKWDSTPPIIRLLGDTSIKLSEKEEKGKKSKDEVYKTIERIKEKQEATIEESGGPEYRRKMKLMRDEENKYYDEIIDEIMNQLPDPGITKENVNTYKIKPNYFK